jgi:hypothetical protein
MTDGFRIGFLGRQHLAAALSFCALGSTVFACCRNRAWASMTHAWGWLFFRLLRRAGQPN